MTPLTTILIILGIVTLCLWIFDKTTINMNIKSPVNMGVFAIVTVWLIIELIRRWV
jgi:hypothetical protein